MLQVSGLTQPPATALGKLKWNSLSLPLSLPVRAKYLHINNVVHFTTSSSLATRAPSHYVLIPPAHSLQVMMMVKTCRKVINEPH